MKKKLSLLSALMFGLTLNATASDIPVTLQNKNLRPMGAGFDSRSQVLHQACVDNSLDNDPTGPVFAHELPSGSFDLKLESSQESLANKLGMAAGGRYRSGVTEYSASAEFLKQSQSNSFSLAYNYVSEHLYQEIMTAQRTRPIRPLPGFEQTVSQRDVFFDRCGDEYVWARDHAARMFININVSFVSRSEHDRFAAQFGMSSPVSSFNASFENDTQKYSTSNQMTVRVIQIGGDPSRIGQIICPKTPTDTATSADCSKSAEAVVNCSFGGIKDCVGMIANAIAYANGQGNDDFPTQIRDGEKYAVTALHTAPYIELGAPFLTPPTEQNRIELQVALKQLSDLFEDQYKLWAEADHYYTSRAPRLTPRQKNEMEKLRSRFDQSLRRASLGINRCYDSGYAICENEVDEVKKFVGLDQDGGIVDKKRIEMLALTASESLVQYCDIADDQNPEIKVTMDSLLKYALIKVEPALDRINKGDKCYNLGQWLEQQTELDLSSDIYHIGDLRPLGLMKNLRTLNMSGKKLADISELGQLTNLETLNLDRNLIQDLNPLKNLTRLTTLSLQQNKLSQDQLAVLATLATPRGQLVSLDARGNSDDLQCPLRDVSQCKLLNMNNMVHAAALFSNCTPMVGHAAASAATGPVLSTGGYAYDMQNYFSAQMQVVDQNGCRLLPNKMTVARAGHTMTTLPDGRFLVVGGHSNSIEVIKPGTYTSTLYNVVMSDLRSQHTTTLLKDGTVLIVGGYTNAVDLRTRTSDMSADVELFNPTTGVIQKIAELAVPRAEHTATLLPDGKVLILGGYSKTKMIQMAEVIDPSSGTVTILDEPMQVGRAGHTATRLLDGRILIAGGYVWSQKVKEGIATPILAGTAVVETFDPKTETFTQLSEKLPVAQGGMKVWELPDHRVMLIGGETDGAFFDGYTMTMPTASASLWIFDPTTNGIYDVGTLGKRRSLSAVAPLGKRSLVVIGGVGDSEAFSTTDLLIYRNQ